MLYATRSLLPCTFSFRTDLSHSILPGAHHAYHGPCSGTKNTSMKKSARHCIALFPPPNITHLAPVVDMSVDHNTQEEIKNIPPWVRIHSLSHIFSIHSRAATGKDDRHDVPVSTSTLLHNGCACHGSTGHCPHCCSDMQVKTFKMLQEILLHVNPSHSAVDNNAWVPSVPLAAIQSPVSLSAPIPSLSSLSPPLVLHPPLGQVVKSNGKPGKPADVHTIILGNGTELKLPLTEIPDPPVVSFVDNIPWLNHMWDNTLIHWQEDSQLHIQGQAIALSHWPVLYKYLGAPTWKGIKGKFFEWKVSSDLMALTRCFPLMHVVLAQVLVRHFQHGLPKEFWSEFTTPAGKLLSYMAIVQRLQEQHEAADLVLVEKAQQEYG